jgi:hypothetical protein
MYEWRNLYRGKVLCVWVGLKRQPSGRCVLPETSANKSATDDQSRQLYQDAVPRKTNVIEFKKEAK